MLAGSAWRTLGLAVPYARFLPAALLPVVSTSAAAAAVSADLPQGMQGKEGLRLLSDRPLNAETPAHLLDDDVTPAEHMFVRNNGVPPLNTDPKSWHLRIQGEACLAPKTFSLAELKANFPLVTLRLQLECGGNGRSEFRPRASGNQWSTGAIACPEWTGVRLKDVLQHCGIAEAAVYVAYVGADTHLSGDAGKRPISRGVPLAKALENESLLAYAMNGADIPAVHGAPLRLVLGGWPASVCGKWLTEILVRDVVHDGAKMGGQSYRVPCKPVVPGAEVADADMCIIASMPVKSLVTFPRSGVRVKAGQKFVLRGHAWAGDRAVAAMHYSCDFGATWCAAELTPAPNRLAWQRWQARLSLPQLGYHEIWARATDTLGVTQPMLVPGWNPRGYLNNACHRIAVQVV